MAIINRLSRFLKADMHAVLDHIEEPELQLKQAVREMGEELIKTETHMQQLQYELEDIEDRQRTIDVLVSKTDEEITICFENNNEDLVRNLIRRKLETKEMSKATSQRKDQLEKLLNSVKKQQDQQASLYTSMQQKSELISTNSKCRPDSSHIHSGIADTSIFSVKDSDIEVALLKERQRFSSKNKVSNKQSKSNKSV